MKAKKFILCLAAFMLTVGLGCASACAEEAGASDGASAPAVSQSADGSSSSSDTSGSGEVSAPSGSTGTEGSGETSAPAVSEGSSETSSDGEGGGSEDAGTVSDSDVSGESENDGGSDVSDVVTDNTGSTDVSDDNAPADTVTDDKVSQDGSDSVTESETETETDAETPADGEQPAEDESADTAEDEGTEADKTEEAADTTETEGTEDNAGAEKQETAAEAGQAEEQDEESYAAAVADVMYETVEQAFSSVEDGDTVYILKDVDLTDTVYINADVTVSADEDVRISGNGTLFSVSSDVQFTVGEGVTLYSANTTDNDPMVALGSNAVLNVEGGTLSSAAVSSAAEGSTVVLGADADVSGDIEVGNYDGGAAVLDVSEYSGDVSVSVDPDGTFDGTAMLIKGGTQDNVSVSTSGYTAVEADGGLAVSEIAVDPSVTVELIYDSELDDPGVYEDVASGWHMTVTAGNKAIETIDPYVDGDSITDGEPLVLETTIAPGSQFVIGIVLERASSEVDSFGALLDGEMYDATRIGRGAEEAADAVDADTETDLDDNLNEAETADESEEDINEEV